MHNKYDKPLFPGKISHIEDIDVVENDKIENNDQEIAQFC